MEIIKKLLLVLDRQQKKGLFYLLLGMLVSALLETLSVSVIAAFVALVADPESFMQMNTVRQAVAVLGLQDQDTRTFLLFLTVVLLIAFILKNIFLYYLLRWQNQFVDANRFKMSLRLMQVIMAKQYTYFFTHNSSRVFQVITNNVLKTFVLINVLLSALAESLLACLLLLLMLVYHWEVTLLLVVIFILLTIVLKGIIQPRMKVLGEKADRYYFKNLAIINKIIGSIKEMKIYGTEAVFLRRYEMNGQKNLRCDFEKNKYALLPRLVIETFCISGLLLVMLVLLLNGNDSREILTQMSVFAVVLMRLMPSCNRLNAAVGSIAFYKPALLAIDDNIQDFMGETTAVGTSEEFVELKREIRFKNVSYVYPETRKVIVKSVDIVFPAQQRIGLMGASGEGKSTTINLLLGLLQPTQGQILVDGKELTAEGVRWSAVGYVPQNIFLLDGSIRENIIFSDENGDEDKVAEVLKMVQMDDFVNSLDKGLDTQIGENGIRLSGGQRQRLGLARALYREPTLLVLDEATAALDTKTEQKIMQEIFAMPKAITIIIVTHRLSTLYGCDLVYNVENGAVREYTEEYRALMQAVVK